jgi:hypothetical protein
MDSVSLINEIQASKPPPKLLYRFRDAIQSRYNFTIEELQDHGPIIKIVITPDGLTYDVLIVTDEKEEIVSILMCFPQKTPATRRAEMARLLGQLTRRIIVGGFEMDPSSGECRLRHSVCCEGIDPPDSFFVRMLRTHVSTGAKLWPLLKSVIEDTPHNVALQMLR